MTSSRRDLGDFQTPVELAAGVLSAVGYSGNKFPRVLEPTCGRGNFLVAASASAPSPAQMHGIEVQPVHAADARDALASSGVPTTIEVGDIFTYDLASIAWHTDGQLIVVGNPPWVTLSELSALSSTNVPPRRNIRRASGISAMTGDSNFDIAEYIWIRLLVELRDQDPTIVLLCKTSVARRILTLAHSLCLPLAESKLWRIDAKAHFGVAADACALMMRLEHGMSEFDCEVYASLDALTPESVMSVIDGELVARADRYLAVAALDGRSPETWRSGVKHDLAAVMELKVDGEKLRNGLNEVVDVEPEFVYPLLKSSDLNADRSPGSRRVLVTQKRLQGGTDELRAVAPRLWAYLSAHATDFANRKSSVYRGRSQFAMFGIGDYTFAPYKIAIAGLYKSPRFRLLAPVDEYPVIVDDTCYFLPFDTRADALIVLALLRSRPAVDLLESLFFPDSKRPVTKKLLTRLDLASLADIVDDETITQAALEAGTEGVDADQLRDALSALRQKWAGEPQLDLV